MNKLRVLDGQVFGRLTVLSVAGKNNSGGYKWHVRCACGVVKKVSSDHLVRPKQPVTSCGCLRNDKVRGRANPDHTAFNLLFSSYQKRAKGKSRDFEITVEQFRFLTKSPCYYCGKEPQTVAYNKPKSGSYIHNGIDRVNSLVGYVPDNCVPCCKLCNYMKMAMTEDDFLGHVLAIASFQKGKEHD